MSATPYPSTGPAGTLVPVVEWERRLAEKDAQLQAERAAHAVTRTERDEAQAIALDLADKHVAYGHEIADMTQDRDRWRDYSLDTEARYTAALEENGHLRVTISDLEAELRQQDTQHEHERQDLIEQCARVLDAPPRASVSIARQVLDVFDVQRDRIAAEHAKAEEWRQAYELMEKFAITEALSQTEKRVLVHRLGLEGYRLGLPIPTGAWPRYIKDEERATSGIHPRTYRVAEKKFDELGFFEVVKKDPQPRPVDGDSDLDRERIEAETRKAGHPYDVRTPIPARIEQFLFEELPTIEVRIETEQDRLAKERRQDRKVKEEATTARLKEEAAAGRQLIRERDTFTRERDEAREAAARAVAEAQRLVREHQRSEALACRGCGQKIDPEDWRCNDCREREAEERREPVAQVLMHAACINRPKVPVVQAAYNNCTATDSGGGTPPEKPQRSCPGCHGNRYHFVDSPRFGPEWRCVTCQPPI